MLNKFLSKEKMQNNVTFDGVIKEDYNLLTTIKRYDIRPIFITGHVTTNKKYWFNGLKQEELIELLEKSNQERLEIHNENTKENNLNQRETQSKRVK